jgi:hypothetical protein
VDPDGDLLTTRVSTIQSSSTNLIECFAIVEGGQNQLALASLMDLILFSMLCSITRVIAQAEPNPESRRSGGHLCHRGFTVEASGF